MKISLYAVGRLKRGGEMELCDRYSERINGQGRSVALGPIHVTEINESKAATAAQRKSDEAQELLSRIPSTAHCIALDERGKSVSSTDFADLVRAIRDDGAAEVAFVIGGPDGHGPALRDAAHRKLALGPMTLPHGLARAVLLEQVYRAVTILAGHPYHRT